MLTLTKKAEDTVISSQENQYNHDGIRIAKKEDGTTRHYYYDNSIIAYTEDGTSLSSANIVGPEGQVVGTYRGDDYHVYLKDIQGSTTNIVKQDGSLSSAYEYSDFGETEEITASSFDNEICYTGAVYDDTTGLYYMNARYYNPENGRFISQDTYRGELNDPTQWHLYAYCANNPINYTDPSGHLRWKVEKTQAIVWVSFIDMEVAGLLMTMNSYGKIVKSAKIAFRELVKPGVETHLAPFRKAKVSYMAFSYFVLTVFASIASARGYEGFRFKLEYKYKIVYKRQVGKTFSVQKFTITPKVWLYK